MAGEKIALVTGAGTGIGKSAALALIRDGFTCVLTGRREEPLQETASASEARERAVVIPSDVSDESSVDALFSQIEERFGQFNRMIKARFHRPQQRPKGGQCFEMLPQQIVG